MIGAKGARLYFAEDTAYAGFFRDIRLRLGPIDLALLPIGAYEPRWFMRSVHMNPAEAVEAHLVLEASESVGMHFGTFRSPSRTGPAAVFAVDLRILHKPLPRPKGT